MKYAFQSFGGENGKDRFDFLIEVEELILLNLSGSVYSCFFGFVRRRRESFFELVGLYLDGDFRWRLGIGILQEEMKIGLYFGVGGWLDIVWSHFLLVLAEVG